MTLESKISEADFNEVMGITALAELLENTYLNIKQLKPEEKKDFTENFKGYITNEYAETLKVLEKYRDYKRADELRDRIIISYAKLSTLFEPDEPNHSANYKVSREIEDKIVSYKLSKFGELDFKEFKKIMKKVEKEITKNKYKEKPKGIDLTELLKPYHNKDLHLAVTKDYSKVVGTGKTIEEAVKKAEEAGYKDIILMRSPDDTLGKRI